MNDIESQLRDAYQAATETVRAESIRPRVLPTTPDHTHSPRRSSMFMPLAAAAAVVVTIGAAVAVPHLVTQPSGAAPAPTATAGAGLGTTSPPFLVVNRGNRLEVRSATTGRILGTVYPPDKHGLWVTVAATGNPRKFAAGLQLAPSGQHCVNSQVYALLYTLTLSSSGAPDGLKPYPVAKIPGWLDGLNVVGSPRLAVSADGSTTAYVTMACIADYTNPKDVETIGVVRDGTVRKWTISLSANPVSLSLSADGSELGYVASPQRFSPGALGSAWVLPTDAAPGDAASRGHRVFTDAMNGGVEPVSEALSPDGKTMYILTTLRDVHGKWVTNGLYAYSTATGARLRTLHTWKNIATILTMGGDKALVWDNIPIPIQEVDLATGTAKTFTQLPVSDMDPFDGLAW
jgi:hypothetical protein